MSAYNDLFWCKCKLYLIQSNVSLYNIRKTYKYTIFKWWLNIVDNGTKDGKNEIILIFKVESLVYCELLS
jgi:hypothetical protein